MSRSLWSLSLALALGAAASAQQAQAPKTEAELDKQVTQILVAFARSAEGWKAPERARRVYQMIVDHYDRENATARTGLGFKRVKDQWQQVVTADKLPKDTASGAQLKLLDDAWRIAQQRIVTLHRDLGLALKEAGELVLAVRHFDRVLALDPTDSKSHAALGHEQFEGFYGTGPQVAFVRRMREMQAKARELGVQDYPVEMLPDSALPEELRGLGITFAGAKSKHFTRWVAGSAEEARQILLWSERALAMMEFLVPGREYRSLLPGRIRWLVVLRTREQRDTLLESREVTRDGEPLEVAKMFGGQAFKWRGGLAEWVYHEPELDADHAVGQVTNRCAMWDCNDGLSEGTVHAMTWLMCGSLHSSYMRIPHTASGSNELARRDPDQWFAQLRADIEVGKDWPAVQVPRERMDNFRVAVRMKSWSFIIWLMARHPNDWMRLCRTLGKERLEPADIEAKFSEVLGRSLAECEGEWREWMRKGSVIGKASGLPD